MPTPPKVRLFVLCDAVVEDPLTGKLALVGIVEDFVAAKYPVEHPACVVFARMTGLRGDYDFRIDMIGPDLQTVVSEGAAIDRVSTDDPLTPVQFAVRLEGVEFPCPGRYTVRLVYNGRIAEEFTLTAELRS